MKKQGKTKVYTDNVNKFNTEWKEDKEYLYIRLSKPAIKEKKITKVWVELKDKDKDK